MLPTLQKSRIEELEDYGELAGLVEPGRLPAPELSRCFVHRSENGKIDGYCFVQPIVVIEPIWVAPELRGRGVAPKLFGEAVESLRTNGNQGFYCRAVTPDVESYLKRLGMREAGKAFEMEFGG